MAVTAAEFLKQLKSKPLVRTFAIDRGAVNADARTVRLAFASDRPIDHWFGKLSLSLNGKAMRSKRLDSGAPLLLDHDPRNQIGVIESYSLGNGVARATVRLSKSDRGEEIFQDIRDGIRTQVSVGFLVHEMHVEKEEKGKPTIFRSDDWEPYEISVVSIPADISVGVGRAAVNSSSEKKKNTMNEFENEDPSVNPHLAVVRDINAFGREFACEDFARQYAMTEGATVQGFMQALQAKRVAAYQSTQLPPMNPHTAAERYGGVEPARVNSRVKLTHFKGNDAEKRAHDFGLWLLGGPMGNSWARQECHRHGFSLQRSQNEGVNEKGGYLVPEEFGADLIDLIEEHGTFRRNAKVVPMSSDVRSDPRITGRLSATFVPESGTTDDQDMEFDRIALIARKAMVLVDFSSEISEDSVLSIGDTLAGEAARAFAEKEDDCGFNGNGNSTYGGITGVLDKLKSVDASVANIKGLQVGSGNSYAELQLADYAKTIARLPSYARKNAKWYMSLEHYWNVIVPLLLESGGVTMGEIEAGRGDRLFGIPIEYADKMPQSEANSQVCAIVGDLAMAASFGDRRKVTISISDAPRFRNDDLTLKATQRFDINVHDVGDTTTAGPIVGLITADS